MAPAIKAQWLKTSGITVRHLLWLLLALTHVAFAIETTEPLAELTRTCGPSARRQRHVRPVSGWRSGAGELLSVYRFNGEHYERFDGGYSPGQVWSPAQGPNGAALGPYGPGGAFVLCHDANKFERLAMGVSPVFAHWRGLLWITFFNQCSINNLRAREIGLIQSAFAVY